MQKRSPQRDVSRSRRTAKGVIGIDEVGRGPLAGPLTVCAVYIESKRKITNHLFAGTISDSKRIKKTLRLNIYQTIRQNRYTKSVVKYAIHSRAASYIDRYGINKAATACIQSCLKDLEKQGISVENISLNLDAGLYAPQKFHKQKRFIKGDEQFVEIALASILAKEWRDAYMKEASKKHSSYGWEQNVGYGTAEHRRSIQRWGVTDLHRKTYLKGFKLLDKPE